MDDERDAKMEINKCPKCGSEPIIAKIVNGNYEFLGYQIDCDDCCLHTGCMPYYVDVVAKWNKITKGVTNETE